MDSLSPFQKIDSMAQTLRDWGKNPTPDIRDKDVLIELVKSVSKLRPYPEGIVTPKHLMTPSVGDRALMRESLQRMSEQMRCDGVNRRVQTACASIVDQDQRDNIENLRLSAQILIEAIDRFSIKFFAEDWPYWGAMSPEETNLHRATYLTWARSYLKESVINNESLRQARQNEIERSWWGDRLASLLSRWPELRTELSPEVPIIVHFLKSYDAPSSEGWMRPLLKHLEKIAEASARLDQPKAMLSDVIQLDESIREFERTKLMIIPTLVEQVRIRELMMRVHGQLQVPTIKAVIEKQYLRNRSENEYLRKLPEIVEEQIMMVQHHASHDLRYAMESWAAVSLTEMSSHWATYCAFLHGYLKDFGKEGEYCLKILKERDSVARCLDERIEGWRTMTADQLAGALGKTAVIFQYSWVRSKDQVAGAPKPFESKGEVARAPKPFESKDEVAGAPKPFESKGEVARAPKPFESKGKVARAPKPFESKGEVEGDLKPWDVWFESTFVWRPSTFAEECKKLKSLQLPLEELRVRLQLLKLAAAIRYMISNEDELRIKEMLSPKPEEGNS